MTVEDCTTYRKAEDGGYGRYMDPAHPAQKILRAFNIETGKVVWQINLPGPVQSNYAGVLSTAGGLLFFGESSGGFAAADAKTGKYLWHYETNHAMKASPMTYEVDGKQYVAIASGPNVMSFALPDVPASEVILDSERRKREKNNERECVTTRVSWWFSWISRNRPGGRGCQSHWRGRAGGGREAGGPAEPDDQRGEGLCDRHQQGA
jgi:hypothetical protein